MVRILIILFSVLSATCTTYASTEIQINLPEYKLRLIDDETVIKSYDIAVGTAALQTPLGNYQVTEKEVDPTWYPTEMQQELGETIMGPGPDNPLGIRWIQFNGVYGIHGTREEDKIGFGYAVSSGCIRMRNQDVEDLYDRIEIGTSINIVYQTIIFAEKKDGLYVRVLPDLYHQNTNTLENYKVVLQDYFGKYLTDIKFPAVTNQDVKLADLTSGQTT